jgi:hypothetical protein
MSTVNAMAGVQTGQGVVLPERIPSELTEPKFTAAQIKKECPARLQQIGREIAERLKKAHKQKEIADNHLIAVNELIIEAKELCDGGGFNKFRELFCPQLGKSQAYVLLAIGTGKKTLAGHRIEERERKRQTRANQKAAAANSGTVPENADPETETPGGRIGDGEPGSTTITPEPSVGPAKGPSGGTTNDSISGFNSHVMALKQRISNHKVDHFAATAIPADILAKIGKFLSDLANLKKSEAAKSAPTTAPTDNSAFSAEQSAEDVRTDADLDASPAAPMPKHVDD